MASIDELTKRLLKRFKEVPKVDEDDVEGWIELAMNEHGFESHDDVPVEWVPLVMLYAEADGASQIALRTAYYFQYTDNGETVNKTRVAYNYQKLSETLWEKYRAKKVEGVDGYGGSRFTVMGRADRP